MFADDAVRAASKEIAVLEGACDLQAFSSGDAVAGGHAGARLPRLTTRHRRAGSGSRPTETR
ncbi:MAG: hypothetical protein ACLT98_17405 [Eggerthellaceae bacterium]